MPYNELMCTVIETETFQHYASAIWTNDECQDFITWIAANPLAGDVIPASGGLRKIRWGRSGMGKRGGTRVIYYNAHADGSIWLLIVYTKSKFDNLPISFLVELKKAIIHG